MTEISGSMLTENSENVLYLLRYAYLTRLEFRTKGMKLGIVIKDSMVERYCMTSHRFWQLTDEDVERMILPRII